MISSSVVFGQVTQQKHVAAMGGKITIGGQYQHISVVGEAVVKSHSGNPYTGNFGYLNPNPNDIVSEIKQLYDIQNSLTIFPNPANDKISVSGLIENVSVKVILTDMAGRIVLDNTYNNNYDKTIDIITNFSSGLYLLTILQNEKIECYKITLN